MAEKLTRAERQRTRRLIRRCRAEVELPCNPAGLELQRQLAVEVNEFERVFHEHLAEAVRCEV